MRKMEIGDAFMKNIVKKITRKKFSRTFMLYIFRTERRLLFINLNLLNSRSYQKRKSFPKSF